MRSRSTGDLTNPPSAETKAVRSTASDIIRIDRFDQREILGCCNQSIAWAPQRQPDLLDPFSHPTTCVNQLLDGSGIEGRVIDLIFAMME